MRAALTVWDGRISPVFDVSREAEVLTIENGVVVARRRENIEAPTAALKVDRVMALRIETLICGAITDPFQQELTARGVRVLGFVAGEVDAVVQALMANKLPTTVFTMPGCCGGQNRFRGGRGGGGRGDGGRRGNGRGPKERP